MIRLVLAVVLAGALLSATLPAAERADRDRSAALAGEELESLAATAERLAAENDPVAPTEGPAATTVVLEAPTPALVDPGRFRIDNSTLRFERPDGENRTVRAAVPIRTPGPIIARTIRLRLSFVRVGERTAVSIERERRRV